MNKILFFGTSEYCLPVVQSLSDNFQLSAVVTKTPPNPVFSFAKDYGIPVFTPDESSQFNTLKSTLNSFNSDLAVVADYGLIIPPEIFTLPKHETINIHFSRLPGLRGASPVQYTVLFGLKDISVSVIKLAESLDTGDIVKINEYPDINPDNETTGSLYRKLFERIAPNLPQIIKGYLKGELVPIKQNDANASYTRKITREDGYISFNNVKNQINGAVVTTDEKEFSPGSLLLEAFKKSDNRANTFLRALRAFDPWPGIWTVAPQERRLKILNVEIREGKIAPSQVQLEGKKPVSWSQFLDGYPEVKSAI